MSEFLLRVKKFRIKLFLMLLVVFIPAIIMKIMKTHVENLDDSPVFIAVVFMYIAVGIVIFFKFLNIKCPRCGQGYFTKYDYMPKLMYKLKCQNCSLNVFMQISAGEESYAEQKGDGG